MTVECLVQNKVNPHCVTGAAFQEENSTAWDVC